MPKRFYWKFINPSTGLFNGNEYVDYSFGIKDGQPFFQTPDFRNGYVVYNGVKYEDVPIVYDELKDLVVINDPLKFTNSPFIDERVTSFNIEKYHFVRLVNDQANNEGCKDGYYQVLYGGYSTVYERQEKKLKEETSLTEGLKRFIVTKLLIISGKTRRCTALVQKGMLDLFG